ncbi:hypothetical protein C5167_021969, partial [Papaver somniferum]
MTNSQFQCLIHFWGWDWFHQICILCRLVVDEGFIRSLLHQGFYCGVKNGEVLKALGKFGSKGALKVKTKFMFSRRMDSSKSSVGETGGHTKNNSQGDKL